MNNDLENGADEPRSEEPNGDSAPEPKVSPIATGQINVTDLLGLGKASENLRPVGRSIAEAVQQFFGPAQRYLNERAEGAARRHEIEADAKALQQLQNRLADDPASLELVKTRFLNTEIRRQSNIEEATLLAVEYAETNSANDHAQKIDEDFMAEWVNGVKDVSNEVVRQFWARILAEAPKSEGGRVSKPVIDLLKQFDHIIAQNFTNFITLHVCTGGTSVGNEDFWETIGLRTDFDLLKDIGAIEIIDGPTLHRFGSWEITQSGEMIGSNIALKAIPSIRVWRLRSRALDLARVLFSNIDPQDENLKYQILKSNLQSLANDEHQYLRISIKMKSDNKPKIVEISHPKHAFFNRSQDNEMSTELDSRANHMISEIMGDCEDMPLFALGVLAEFAHEGRLRIVSVE